MDKETVKLVVRLHHMIALIDPNDKESHIKVFRLMNDTALWRIRYEETLNDDERSRLQQMATRIRKEIVKMEDGAYG